MKKKNIKISVILVAMLISIVSIIAGTNAYFSSRDDVTNAFVAGDVDIEVDERDEDGVEFSPPNSWGGSTEEDPYPKKVRIENKSSVNALIRVAIVPRWVSEDNNGNDNAWAGDTNIVKLNLVNTSENITDKDKWIYGDDGYYYYNGLVGKGEYTKYLLESVYATIPEGLEDRYDGKKLIVDVKAEAVQATQAAYEKTWPNIVEDSPIRTMLNDLCS